MKLRVTSSQCAGSKFVLSFGLRCRSLGLGYLARMTVCTSPVEVYSHLQYLTQAEEIGIRPSSSSSSSLRSLDADPLMLRRAGDGQGQGQGR
jgi:hypothetical protein